MNKKTFAAVSMVALLAGNLQANEVCANNSQTPSKCHTQNPNAPKGKQPKPPMPMMEGYNAPAAVHAHGNWDYFLDGTFNYWKATQDNMEVGIVVPSVIPNAFETNGIITQGNLINMGADYKPGFKIETGFKSTFDDWDVTAAYTWYGSTNTAHRSINSPSMSSPGMIFPTLGHSGVQTDEFYNDVNSNWRLRMNFGDLLMGRTYQVGKKLTFHSYTGLRAAWIKQKLKTTYTNSVYTAEEVGTVLSNERSHSWALGPRVGVDLNWNLGGGVRIYSNNAADLLYTKYTQITSYDGPGTANVFRIYLVQDDLDCVRSHFEFELGTGWGSYFSKDRFWLDLSAGYTFQIFMSQNMFAKYVNNETFQLGQRILPNGDLYVQGFTGKAAFHF